MALRSSTSATRRRRTARWPRAPTRSRRRRPGADSVDGPRVPHTFTIDRTPPPAPSLSGTPSGDSASFTFASAEPGVSYRCQLTGPGQAGTPAACADRADYSGLAPGDYRFLVRTIDPAGNSSAETTRDFTRGRGAADAQRDPTPTPTATPDADAGVPARPWSRARSAARSSSSCRAPREFVELDATRGHPVRLDRRRQERAASSSRPSRRKGKPPQKAVFYGGIFLVTQTGRRRSTSSSPSRWRRARRSASAAAAKKAEVAQAVGRRQGQVPHARASTAPRRPRHDLARAGHVRRHAHARSSRASCPCATSVRKKTVLVARAHLPGQTAPLTPDHSAIARGLDLPVRVARCACAPLSSPGSPRCSRPPRAGRHLERTGTGDARHAATRHAHVPEPARGDRRVRGDEGRAGHDQRPGGHDQHQQRPGDPVRHHGRRGQRAHDDHRRRRQVPRLPRHARPATRRSATSRSATARRARATRRTAAASSTSAASSQLDYVRVTDSRAPTAAAAGSRTTRAR